MDVSGRWSVTFTEDNGKEEAAVGEFSQSSDVVTGTFLTNGGDHRYLAGQVQGNQLFLSTFAMLQTFYGFPTTVIVDRNGQVRKIHTGFSGPATGEHYVQFVKEFKNNLEQLLAEGPGGT